MGANVWIEFVPSGANISDLPSRMQLGGECPQILRELCSIEFEFECPPVGACWAAVFADVFAKLAPPPSKADRKYRGKVVSEVRRLCELRGYPAVL